MISGPGHPTNATCVSAWSNIQHYVKTMGLTLNNARTGAVRMSRKSFNPDQIVPFSLVDLLPPVGQIRWGYVCI